MITMKPGNYINEYYGLTTDTKPTDPYLPNASIFYEMDTGDIYLYDAANGEWVLQPSWEGGSVTVEIDGTLTKAGAAADAKATGDRIASATIELDTMLTKEGAAAEAKATGNALNQLGSSLGQSISAAATQLGNGINAVKYAVAQEFDESKVHDVMSYVWHDGKLYRIDSAHAPGVTWANTVCTEVILADEMTSISASASLAINNLNTSVSELEAEMDASTVTVTGTDPVITAEANTRYVCGEVYTISITPPASGICDVTFTSGSTAAVLTVPNTVTFPSWFDATTLETNTIYEINIADGLAAVMSWAS